MEYKEHTHVRTEVWDSCTNCSVRNSASSELLPHCHLHAPVPDTQLGCVGSSGFVGGAAPDCWTNFIGDMKWSHHISCLVGGWTNPSKKYDRQIGILPQIGVKIKHIWNHHLDVNLFSFIILKILNSWGVSCWGMSLPECLSPLWKV